MILHPGVLALLVSSVLGAGLVIYAAVLGGRILTHWDIQSGSELQLVLERKTYLISTILACVLGFQLVSFFLYIFTADHLHTLFVGAMCAAGTLNVNIYGYPALVLKIVTFVLGGLWLILNYTDNRAYDYPLIKAKYTLLLFVAPMMFAEMAVLGDFLLRLEPNVITSCCGSLFTSDASGVASDLAALPVLPTKVAFYSSLVATAIAGFYFLRLGRGGYVFSLMSVATFLISVASLISFISLYFYELPTHHCPFDILQKEYGFIGYPIYLCLLGGVVAGVGVGVLMPYRTIPSLKLVVPSIQKKLVVFTLALFALFSAIAPFRMVFTDFTLEGY